MGDGTVAEPRLRSPRTSSIVPSALIHRTQIQNEIAKNFKMATEEFSIQGWASLLYMGPLQLYCLQDHEVGSLYIFIWFDLGVRAGGEYG